MLGDHVNIQLKQGVKIITCDPATGTIEAETRNGEVISVNAYYYSSAFRWPVPGESWMVREENASWFLDGIYEQQLTENVRPMPGDVVLSSSTGRVLLNVGGTLTEIFRTTSFPRLPANEESSVIVLRGSLVPKKH